MPDRGRTPILRIIVISAVLSACGAHDTPVVDRTPLVVGSRLQVRPLVTGFEGTRTALESNVTPQPVAAVDATAWAAMWSRANLTSRAPKIAFERELGVLYGFSRSSCNQHRASLDSARLEGPDSVRIFVSDQWGGICLDTVSFTVVAAAVRRAPRWSTPPRIIARLER